MGFFEHLQDFLGYFALENNYLALVNHDGNLIVGNDLYISRFGLHDGYDVSARQFAGLDRDNLQDIKAQIRKFAPWTKVHTQEILSGDIVSIEWLCYEFNHGGQNYLLKIGCDVTEREYLRQRLREIGSVAKIGYWRVNTDSREVHWSPEVYKIHGLSESDFVPTTRSLGSLYGEDVFALIHNNMRDCVGKGKPFTNRCTVTCNADAVKHIEIEGSPEFNRNGKIIAISGTFRDRTDEAQAESRHSDTHDELRRAKDITKHLEKTLDEHALVSIADVAGKIIYVNQKFCDVSGYSSAELIGQNHRILKSNEHEPAFYEDLWRTISSGDVWRGKICNLRKSGDPYWVSSTIVPFLDSITGKPLHYVSVRTDITQLKTFQSHQDELLHKAIELSQAKSDFLANMSHELRTPLNAILGYSEMLQEQYFGKIGNEKYLEYVNYIHSSGDRLLGLINDVLDISKIEAGRYEITPAPAEMEKILDDIFHEFVPMAEVAEVKLQVENPDSLNMVYVDEKAVKQIIANLVSNAIKFSSAAGQVTLTVRGECAGMATIEVKDDGVGMSKRDMEIALSPFGQVKDAQSRGYQGTGLGLPLCKHLAQLHGGELLLDSEPGAGTCITVRIPTDEITLKRKSIAG
ncbi:ATP-binding protein [Emcibacter nanhaiensis]|uniref:histidine kinase n=1 Tax=Emcibacter nanhaiensis TaxID=1505037 RepID=A0A501PCQ2_9PROT|nr:ATP-binding protein [Emcibacter nanhaiensis]TPD57684.1 PAS domain S-box protein [Emcibacter nanhaiensis]